MVAQDQAELIARSLKDRDVAGDVEQESDARVPALSVMEMLEGTGLCGVLGRWQWLQSQKRRAPHTCHGQASTSLECDRK